MVRVYRFGKEYDRLSDEYVKGETDSELAEAKQEMLSDLGRTFLSCLTLDEQKRFIKGREKHDEQEQT